MSSTTTAATATHPAHGEFTCVEVEESSRRGWDKASSLATRVAALEELLAEETRRADIARAEATALTAQVNLLTSTLIDAEQSGPVGTVWAGLDEADFTAAWRTRRARGPVAATWSPDTLDDDAVAVVREAMLAAGREALLRVLPE